MMKAREGYRVVLKRWNKNKPGYDSQVITKSKDTILSICAREDHRFCTHDEHTVVLRNQLVDSILILPALNETHVFLRKEGE
jgi:hypothetical protein